MTNHFENLWEEAELLSLIAHKDQDFALLKQEVKNNIDNVENNKSETIGKILFMMCYMTKIYNIDAYRVLNDELNNVKINIYE